jgi:myo-inositol-1(or 4)-monophosphatase
VAGAVYNPVTKELFSFKKGGGAFLNGKSIRVSPIEELSKAIVFFHAGRKPDVWDWAARAYRSLLERAHKTSNFSGSALDICFIAAGRIEAAVYGLLTTRDIGAALGILTEAGGIAADKNGSPVTFSPEPQKLLAANNEKILAQLREFL